MSFNNIVAVLFINLFVLVSPAMGKHYNSVYFLKSENKDTLEYKASLSVAIQTFDNSSHHAVNESL